MTCDTVTVWDDQCAAAAARRRGRIAGATDAAAFLHGSHFATTAEPERWYGAEGRAHARQVARMITAVAQQQLLLTVTSFTHLARHQLDRWAGGVAAHLARACAAVVERSLRVLARVAKTVQADGQMHTHV